MKRSIGQQWRVVLGVVLGSMTAAVTAQTPTAALLKSQTGGTGPYTFNPQGSGTSVLLDPTIAVSASGQPWNNPTGDASTGIQNAISMVATASGSKGGVIFLKPGTYHLTKTIKIKGLGVQLVGVKDSSGNYPTLTYDNSLVDADYDNKSAIEISTAVLGHNAPASADPCSGSTRTPYSGPVGTQVSVLEHPAVIRILGNEDYGPVQPYSYEGLVGINITHTNTGSGDGATATGLALQGVHESICRDITIDGAFNGLDVGAANSPFFRNITILNLPNSTLNFGARLGSVDLLGSNVSNGLKFHGLTVKGVTGNTGTVLVTIPGNASLIGGLIQNGAVGLVVNGITGTQTLPSTPNKTIGPIPADDAFIRSVEIDNVAQQGVLLDYAQQIYLVDVTINSAGGDAFQTTTNYYTGLVMTNLTTNNTGLNGIHVQNGLNLNFANAVLHNSNLTNTTTGGGIRIESRVSSFTLGGGEIGSTSGTGTERHGITYLGNTTVSAANGPWYGPPQTINVANVNFLTIAGGNYAGSTTQINHVNDGAYSTLTAAGYFAPPDSETWTLQQLSDDPALLSGPLSVVRGFNSYDVAAVRDSQWIDLTLITGSQAVVTQSGGVATFDPNSFYFHYWEGVAETQFGGSGKSVVLYLPAGHFTFDPTTHVPTAWTPIQYYQLTKRLLIDQPNIQLVGDGRGVTALHNYTFSGGDNLDNGVKVYTGSDGSGVFGLSVQNDSTLLTPCPSPNMSAPVYLPAFVISGTSKIRMADVEATFGMGGAVSVTDTINSEFYSIMMSGMGVNNAHPTTNLPNFSVVATTNGSTQDIRIDQVYGTFTRNIWDNTLAAYVTDAKGGTLPASSMPSFDWVQVTGGVQRIRVDCSTMIEGNNGLVARAGGGGYAPQHVSTTFFADDHIYLNSVDIQAAANVDFVLNWLGGGQQGVVIESPVTGNVRLSSHEVRGCALEGALIQGGTTVALVNDQIGNNSTAQTSTPPAGPHGAPTRPAASYYLGGAAGTVNFVSGNAGWLGNAAFVHATTDNNSDNFGIVLGAGWTGTYTLYGTDTYGNVLGRVGQQTSGTSATVLVPN